MAIVVTNNSDSDFSDRFDGRDYNFPPGKKVLLTEPAALHIFGFGAPDKTPYLARLGWMRTSGEFNAAMAKLGLFSFDFFDPYAQFDDIADNAAAGDAEQQLSPVAAEAGGMGGPDGLPRTPANALQSGDSVLARLQGQ